MNRVSLDLESSIKMVGSLSQIKVNNSTKKTADQVKLQSEVEKNKTITQMRNIKNNILVYTLESIKLDDIERSFEAVNK